jgi:p-cymene monooxygenase
MDHLRYFTGLAMQLVGLAGILAGGAWAWSGFTTLLVLAAVDPLLGIDLRTRRLAAPGLALLPAYLCAFMGPVLIFAVAWKVAHGETGLVAISGMILSLGWLGVVPIVPAVHELYHSRSPISRFLGLYLQLPYVDCSRGVAHMLAHHLYVGTRKDPDTPLRGETVYGFVARVMVENYREFYAIEKASQAKRGHSVWSWHGILPRAIAAYLVFAGALFLVGGVAGAAVAIGGTLVSRVWVEAFNYFQHYGLIRVENEPIARRHVWNHLSPIVRAAGFEITNHAEHHLDPSLPYHALVPDADGPQMPSIFLCFVAALAPSVFFDRIALPRLEHWDRHHASPAERELAREANRRAGWPDWLATPAEVSR